MKAHRVAIVDKELNQVTFWTFLDKNDKAHWEILLIDKPTLVTQYLIHDTFADLIGIRNLDIPMQLKKGMWANLIVSSDKKWAKLYTKEFE
jgi:hypothetical protein